MSLQILGWVATAVFSCSYFFRKPEALRRIQAFAALLWVAYGVAIGAMPVVAANVIVAALAIYSSVVRPRGAAPEPSPTKLDFQEDRACSRPRDASPLSSSTSMER